VYVVYAFSWFGKGKYRSLSLTVLCHWSLHRLFHMTTDNTVFAAS